MKFASANRTEENFAEALDGAMLDLLVVLGVDSPDLIMLFLSPHHLRQADVVLDALHMAWPDATVVGCSGTSIVGAGQEIEGEPAISITAVIMPDVARVPFHLHGDEIETRGAEPMVWRDRLDLIPEQQPVFLVFLDPFSADANTFIGSLDAAFPGCVKVGGMASGGREPGSVGLFFEDRVVKEGAIGVALYGDIQLDAVVAQGCIPVGPSHTITKCDRNLLFELDDRPVFDVVEDDFKELGKGIAQRFTKAPMIGLGLPDGRTAGREEYLIRNIVGVDRGAGLLAIGAHLKVGCKVRFHLLDPQAAAVDLGEMLDRAARHPTPPAGAVLFSCLGRGAGFFGEPNHDTGLLRARLGAIPVGGVFCNGEIGPVHGQTHLHGYTSAFALFRPRGWS